jgi:hypothetical protein
VPAGTLSPLSRMSHSLARLTWFDQMRLVVAVNREETQSEILLDLFCYGHKRKIEANIAPDHLVSPPFVTCSDSRKREYLYALELAREIASCREG